MQATFIIRRVPEEPDEELFMWVLEVGHIGAVAQSVEPFDSVEEALDYINIVRQKAELGTSKVLAVRGNGPHADEIG